LGIGVDAGDARVHVCEAAPVRSRQRHADTRLNQPVALPHHFASAFELRSVEWVRDRADELSCTITWQEGVRVQRDHELRSPTEVGVAELGREGGRTFRTHLADQLHQGPALALPAHPRAFGLVVGAVSDQEMEGAHAVLGLVALVELGYPANGGLYDLAVLGTLALACGPQVAEQPKPDVDVAVCQVGDLEVLDDRTDRAYRGEEGRDDYQRAMGVVGGAPEVELRKHAWWEDGGRDPIDYRDGEVGEGDDGEQ